MADDEISTDRRVEVTAIHPVNGSSIWHGEGTDLVTGETVLFGGDWRPMRDIADALSNADEDSEPIVAEVPSWAVVQAVAP